MTSHGLCRTCKLPLRNHSIVQLKSCESLLQAKENFDRIIKKNEEERERLMSKLTQQPKKG